MEIIYKASTGLEFNSAVTCRLHELWQESPEMDWPDFIVANISQINEIIQGSTIEVKQEEVPTEETEETAGTEEIDWSKVPKGTSVYVRDSLNEPFAKEKFFMYIQDSSSQFVCYDDSNDDCYVIGWKYAKLAE